MTHWSIMPFLLRIGCSVTEFPVHAAMNLSSCFRFGGLLCFGALLVAQLGAADAPVRPSASAAAPVALEGGYLVAAPDVAAAGWTLQVTTPDGQVLEAAPGLSPWVALSPDGLLAEGRYEWSLVGSPQLNEEQREALAWGRASGQGNAVMAALREQGVALGADLTFSGSFRVHEGEVIGLGANSMPEERAAIPDVADQNAATRPGQAATPLPDDKEGFERAAQYIGTDLSVSGSLQIGTSSLQAPNFGFDTMRLTENNLRIHFQDDSTSGSFPTRDWRLVANDTNNGGANYFAIQDAGDNGALVNNVFRVNAGAPNNAFVISDRGNVSMNTNLTGVDFTIASADTPEVRLNQDGSGGWAAQVWDVAGNESNFFVRDVNHDAALPFRIRPSTPDDTLLLTPKGVAVNITSVPKGEPWYLFQTAPFFVQAEDGEPTIIEAEHTSTTAADRPLVRLDNLGGSYLEFVDRTNDPAETWQAGVMNGAFIIDFDGNGLDELRIGPEGGLVFGTGTDTTFVVSPAGTATVSRTEASALYRTVLTLDNAGGSRIEFTDTFLNERWDVGGSSAVPGGFEINYSGSGDGDFFLGTDGALSVGTGTETKMALSTSGELTLANPSGSVQDRAMLRFENPGGSYLQFADTDANRTWEAGFRSGFQVSFSGTGGTELTIGEDGSLMVGPGSATTMALDPSGNLTITGSLSESSSRLVKEAFAEVDVGAILERVVALPLQSWRYREDASGARHLGPFAEDFHKAFGLGKDAQTISAVDRTGVALAAIQALHAEIEARDERIAAQEAALAERDARLQSLEARLERLEQLVQPTEAR